MNTKRRAASLLLGVLLAACAGAPGTPTPAGLSAPIPSATPALSPSPTAVASAAATPDPSPSPTTAVSGLPAGWQHELVCPEDGMGCQLHLYDAAGREQSGWPMDLSGCWSEKYAVGSDGVAYIACKIDDQRVLFSAVDVGGASLAGWPIRATGYPLRVEVGRDGTVYFGTVNEAGDGALSIHAFGPDGYPRVGWPTALPRVAARWTADFTLAPDGTVVGWWYEDLAKDREDLQAARTKYTMIGPNGRTLAGWPVTSIGTATAPVVTKDGSLFYTSATAKVWGHDRSGQIIDGWPYQLRERVAPELRPDGRLMFILGGWTADDDSEVIVLTTAGRVASGWPYRTSHSLHGPVCSLHSSGYFPDAVSADGTLYLAPWTDDRAEILALDRRGRVVTGWPSRLPAGSRVVELETGSAGQLVVSLRDCSAQDWCCNATRQITLTPAGELAP